MDKSKIDKLLHALADLDEEIIKGVQKPLLHVRDTDWQALIPGFQGDCEAILDGLRKAEKVIVGLMRKTTSTRDTATQIYNLHKETQDQIAPTALGQSIAVMVGSYLVQGIEIILVDVVQKQLVDTGILPYVKNPAAVIASILARDERLERVGKGKFKKKIPKDLEEQTMQKA